MSKAAPKRLFPTKQNLLEGPEARSGHRIVVDDGNIYCYGGYNPTSPTSSSQGRNMEEFPMFRELWKYNLSSNKWQQMQTSGNMPRESASYACILVDHKLFMLGGTGFPFAQVRNNLLYCCDLESLHWTSIKCSGTFPEKVYGHTMIYLNGYIYLFGGTTGFLYNHDMFKLNTETWEWQVAYSPVGDDQPCPSPRYRHEMTTDGRYLYVFGGGTSVTAEPLSVVWAFDTIEECWISIPTKPDDREGFPAPRKCHGCVQKDQYVFITGGLGNENTPAYKDTWRYHMPTSQWTKLPINLRKEVYFHATAISPACGSMYTFGGVLPSHNDVRNMGQPSRRSRALYKIELDVKPLIQMCWEYLVLKHPSFIDLPEHQLLHYGIPQRLLSRLDSKSAHTAADSELMVASAS